MRWRHPPAEFRVGFRIRSGIGGQFLDIVVHFALSGGRLPVRILPRFLAGLVHTCVLCVAIHLIVAGARDEYRHREYEERTYRR